VRQREELLTALLDEDNQQKISGCFKILCTRDGMELRKRPFGDFNRKWQALRLA
jgi:hypothetical protein